MVSFEVRALFHLPLRDFKTPFRNVVRKCYIFMYYEFMEGYHNIPWIYLMDLHVRRLLWTPEGWPVIAPERYVDIPQTGKTSGDLIGKWEYICLEKTESRNFSTSIILEEDGTIDGLENSGWSYANDVLELSLEGGTVTAKALLSDEWDWENDTLTICFSGLSNEGRSVWGKKI